MECTRKWVPCFIMPCYLMSFYVIKLTAGGGNGLCGGIGDFLRRIGFRLFPPSQVGALHKAIRSKFVLF